MLSLTKFGDLLTLNTTVKVHLTDNYNNEKRTYFAISQVNN